MRCFALLSLLFMIGGCIEHASHKRTIPKGDRFYRASRVEDLCRLPLVKPLEALSADNNYSWTITLDKDLLHGRGWLSEIDSVGVNGQTLVVYCGRTSVPGQMTNAWFLIDMGNRFSTYFTSKEEYEKHLKKNKLFVRLYEIHELFRQFDKLGILPAQWPANRKDTAVSISSR